MPAEIDAQYRVERRQRYAHLFWIPTFGIGKVWVLRDIKTEKLYEPNAVILQALNSLPLKEKTPWYTFALPILALAVAIIAPIYMKIDEYASDKRYEAQRLESNLAMEEAIKSPSKYQYFELRDSDYKKSFLKVVGSDQNSLKCLIVTGDYDDPSYLKAFAENKGVLDTVAIDKQKLIQSIDQQDLSAANAIAALPDGRARTLTDKYVHDVAFFHNVSSGYEEGKFLALLENLGTDVTLDTVSVKSSNLTLAPLPKKLAFGEQFQLVGTYTGMDPQYEAEWSFKNPEGTITTYEVYIHSARIYFNKK